MNVKDLLKNKRQQAGLTMKQLADRIGVSEGTVSRWESGEIANMRRDNIIALVEVLEIPIEKLMGWDDDPRKSFKKQLPLIPVTAQLQLQQDFYKVEQELKGYFDIINDVQVDVCIEIKGDCMQAERLNNGDKLFICKHNLQEESGKFYVVRLLREDIVAFKRIFWQDKHVILIPVMGDRKPIIRELKDIEIIGKCVGAYKSL